MNANKCIEYLQNIFHLQTLVGENGDYELSDNYWGLKFIIRSRRYTIFISNQSGRAAAKCSIDSDEDSNTVAAEIVAFIGDVLRDIANSGDFKYDGTSGILAWPYNCNLAYVDYLVEAMDMGENESSYDYDRRKAGLTNARKPIKSSRDTSNDYGFHWDGENIYDKDGNHWYFGDYISGGIEPYSSYIQAVKKTEDTIRDSFTEDEISDPEDYAYQLVDFAVETMKDSGKFIKEYEGFVDSSRKPVESAMQGQEKGIQAIMDEYGCTREEAIEIMNGEVTSGCHGESKKKTNEEIKSSDEILSGFDKNKDSLSKVF